MEPRRSPERTRFIRPSASASCCGSRIAAVARARSAGGCLAALVVCAAAVAPARGEPPQRERIAIGFGLGAASVRWTEPDGERRREESGTGLLRGAWVVERNLLLGVELWGWAKDAPVAGLGDGDADVTLWAAAAAATKFFGDTGLFVRGGAGVGGACGEISTSAAVSTHTDTALALLAAAGYEAGLTPHSSLGGSLHAVYAALDGVFGDVLAAGLTVQFNWYW